MFKKIFIISTACIIFLFIILFKIFSIADLIRIKYNINLKDHNIKLNFTNVPDGLHQEPFSIDFSYLLNKYSDKKINLSAINNYTVGNFDKDNNSKLNGISNFLDPTSKFKDTWFGVYIIFDNDQESKKFMLIDSQLSPEDFNNFNIKSILKLPEIDQKLIFNSSLQGMKHPLKLGLKNDFTFVETNIHNRNKKIVEDKSGRKWLRITSEFKTFSALTDIKKTKMKLFDSIRSYIGLPDERVYDIVDPWHEITIIGSINVRYFECKKNNFWALVYYNGTSFNNKQDEKINTWENSDLRQILERMFYSLEIDCIQ